MDVFESDSIAAGANTVSVNSNADFNEGYAAEVSGLAATAFDKFACASGASVTSLSTGNTATTSFANEYILTFFSASGGQPTLPTSGYTSRSTLGSNDNNVLADKTVSSTGAQSAASTFVLSNVWGIVATFKSASQPGGGGGGFGGKAGIGGKAGVG
jgi:hypothetical protein